MSKIKILTIIIAVAVVLGAVVFAYQRNQKLQSIGEQTTDENSPIVYQDDGFIRLKVDVGPDILIDNRDGSVETKIGNGLIHVNDVSFFVRKRTDEEVARWIIDRRVENKNLDETILERTGNPLMFNEMRATLWTVTANEAWGISQLSAIHVDDKKNGRLLVFQIPTDSIKIEKGKNIEDVIQDSSVKSTLNRIVIK